MEMRRLPSESGEQRLELVGRITIDTSSFQGEMLTQPHTDVLTAHCGEDVYQRPTSISLQQSNYIDSSGVAWLLKIHSRFVEGGGLLVLHSASPQIQDLLRLMRVDTVLNVVGSEAEARRRHTELHQENP